MENQDHIPNIFRQADCLWWVGSPSYFENENILKILVQAIQDVKNAEYNKALQGVNTGSDISRSQYEKMILSNIAANCCYLLGKINEAEHLYNTIIDLSEQQDFQLLYKNDINLARAVFWGNFALILVIKGNLSKALEFNLKAIEFFKRLGLNIGEANQLANLGYINLIQGDLDHALKNYQEALHIDQEINDKQGEAYELNNLGLYYFTQGSMDLGVKNFQNALIIFQEKSDLLGIASCYTNFGQYYLDLYNFPSALKYFQDALQIYQKTETKRGEGISYCNIGEIHLVNANLDVAFFYLQKALSISKAIGDKIAEAHQKNLQGRAYSLEKDLQSQALKYFNDSLKIYSQIGDQINIIQQLEEIGKIYERQQNFNLALENFQNCIEICKRINFKKGEAEQYFNLGNLSGDKGDNNKAQEYFKNALSLFKEIGYDSGIASSLCNIGVSYRNLGDFQNAKDYLQEGLRIFRKIGDKKFIGFLLFNLSDLLRQNKSYNSALECLREGERIFKECNAKIMEANFLESIGLLYHEMGDKEMEERYLKESNAVKTMFFNELKESNSKITLNTGREIKKLDEIKKPDEMKDIEELVKEIETLKDQNKIYDCLLCISVTVGFALTYVGEAAAIASGCIFVPIMIISLIQWIRTTSRIKKLQKIGLSRLPIST